LTGGGLTGGRLRATSLLLGRWLVAGNLNIRGRPALFSGMDGRGRYPKSPEHRAKISAALRGRKITGVQLEAIRKAHQDPVYRQRVSETSHRTHRTPEFHVKQSAVQKKLWTPERRREQAIVAGGVGVDVRKRISRSVARLWHDSKYQEIQARSRAENRGSNNHCWKGGVSLRRYAEGVDKTLKELLHERDGWFCRVCGNRGRDVHHIDSDSRNNDLKNLCFLCRSCHKKVHLGGITLEVMKVMPN